VSVRLPGGRIDLPPLGFGCAYLIGGFNAPAARRMVDRVFEMGLRHFDVAPLYGGGFAEDVLGAALQGRRDRVSIATKVGLPRPARTLSTMARSLLAPLRARFQRLARASGEGPPGRGRFDLPFVEASVSESLRRLRTERLDLLLLHEVDAEDVSDALAAFLERGRSEGRFGAIGVGAARERCEAIAARFPGLFDVWQYSWSPLDAQPPQIAPGGAHVLHRTVMRALAPLAERVAGDRAFAARASAATGLDLARREELSPALIAASIAANPGGLVLAASRSQARMESNIAAVTDPRYAPAGATLLALLREDRT
jgi:aryl-alcohol dehydrogenase-like predicted oxidoreductase